MESQADPRGSVWRRWDPHIHTPGTARNDQFGPDSWDPYLTLIEQSEPRIQALGVTDYYSIDNYETVLSHRSAGRLPDVGLIFPNIELRLPLATKRDHAVNLHLLVSPDDPDHIVQVRKFLKTLKFSYNDDTYLCERGDLVSLGKAHKPEIVDERAALAVGANLFKVSTRNLKESFAESAWAQANIIFAVPGSSVDGASGLRDENGSMEGVRLEIERMAHVIFSSSPAQRAFWTGAGALSGKDLADKYHGRKLCLHGSDAHKLEAVGKPAENRYTWIKGDATFEALRQACLEPAERAIVAESPPESALAYRVIDTVTVADADWLATPSIPLASGLVAIIGARGSGKTALADLIAAGAGAASSDPSDQTFLQRAHLHLAGSSVKLAWGDGATTKMDLPPWGEDEPRVRYLSQQFVERLCSSEGITDELLGEIERVIFEAHPYEERLGTSSFRDLLDLRASHGRDLREFAKNEIFTLTEQVEAERTARDALPDLTSERSRLVDTLADDKRARGELVIVGGEQRAQRLEAVNGALVTRQSLVDDMRRREKSLLDLKAAIEDVTTRRLPAIVAEFKRNYAAAALTDIEWEALSPRFSGDPGSVVSARLREAQSAILELSGPEIPKPVTAPAETPPFVADDADLSAATLSSLRLEAIRLGALIGLDSNRQKQLQALNDKIARNEAALTSLHKSIEAAEGALDRIKALMLKRTQAYASVFDGFALEEKELEAMYFPLREMLGEEGGTLGKLTFSVRRVVDINGWASWGEDLLDVRKGGAFRGRGELLKRAKEKLLVAWESGASADVAAAMAAFREEHGQDFIDQARAPRSDVQAFRTWALEISAWLNSVDHISVSYGVQYDGVDIEQLSPGTRGIVLLLLYLAVDQTDDRPLIIDQPEENLDPKSIFDELVERFIETRRRRQIIVVTHNANLVVNTDADQVIVASVGPHRPSRLPEMTYVSGGLENPVIRKHVCEILEGGQHAFEERARRLRIRLP